MSIILFFASSAVIEDPTSDGSDKAESVQQSGVCIFNFM